jgi:hypothetical protein
MRDRDRDDVLAKLGFHIARELREPVYDTGLYALDVDGWLVIIGDGWDYMDQVTRDDAANLSSGPGAGFGTGDGEVLYFYTDDEPMCAELASFVDGRVAWSVTYDGSNGVAQPLLEGTLPAPAAPLIVASHQAQQAEGTPGVDHMYDFAPELGRALVAGFRHDQTLSAGLYLPIYALTQAS